MPSEYKYTPKTDPEYIPPEDVVPIIRCKDCGLYYYAYNRVSEEREWTCAVSGEHRSKDDFCSRAIPKEREDD